MPRLLAALSAVALALAGATAAKAASPSVSVYPSPGTHYNLPRTQITFRGIAPGAIGSVTVVGSVSGTHSGRIQGDSDNKGGSFLPSKPFAPGETVTVTTHLNVVGGSGGKFSFAITHPSGPIQPMSLPLAEAGAHGVLHFRSRPDLVPASVTVSKSSAPAEGDIFVAPQFGPSQNGPMILDPQGNIVWFLSYPVSRKLIVTDFRVQSYLGQPVMTWFQGYTNHGAGMGEGVIWDRNYKQIASVHAGNGLQMDLHEFLLSSGRNAWIVAVSPLWLPSIAHKPTEDAVVQEIDIKTGLVMFEWHALDHVPVGDSSMSPKGGGYVFDPYHLNSISFDHGGDPIVSMRNTSAVYGIDRSTGKILWTYGGKHSSFKMGSGTSTAFQHAAVLQPDGSMTVFDDGAGPPRVHKYARGIRVSLDTASKSATLVHEYGHSPQITTNFEGNVQELSGGDVFMGWGQQPYFSEDNGSGQQIFDAHFTVPTSSYRAYRFQWNAQPPTLPALAVSPGSDGTTSLYASWNGATDVAAWRVLAGPAPQSLTSIADANKTGFETPIAVHNGSPYWAVQALSSSGRVLATSAVRSTPAHLAMYGRSLFVSGSGTGGLPTSCFSDHPCSVTTTISAGRTVIATTGKEAIGPGGGTLLYFTLNSAGRSMLAHARGRRLGVSVTIRDASGSSGSAGMTLVPFATSGSGPRRVASNAQTLKFVGLTDFVSSSSGVGGILAGCYSTSPCHVSAKLTAGNQTIATTGREFLGAGELGYVSFTLSSAGRSMLAHAAGNQLPVHVTLSSGATSASADIALVRFS